MLLSNPPIITSLSAELRASYMKRLMHKNQAKDLDIILIIEALSPEFVRVFWKFVKEAGYSEKSVGLGMSEHRHQFYRFKNPSNPSFPYQIELFSRKPDIINIPGDVHITPTPTGEDLSSLSAILMSDDYYNFTIEHSEIIDGIHYLSIEGLIVLKCKAYLEMLDMKAKGEAVDSKHIKKHRNDVFRLTAMMQPNLHYEMAEDLKSMVSRFCETVKLDIPDQNFLKAAGLGRIDPVKLLNIISTSFL